MDEWKVVSRKKGLGRRLAAPYVNSWSHHYARESGSSECGGGGKVGAAGNGFFAKAWFEKVGIADNEEEEEKLLGRVKKAMTRVEQSSFFEKFMKQMAELQVIEKLVQSADEDEHAARGDRNSGNDGKVEGGGGEKGHEGERRSGEKYEEVDVEVEKKAVSSSVKVEMVLYGVGSIHTAEIARSQLALAMLMQRRFSSVGQLLVYDPIMTPIECRVMRSLGCVPLETNENGGRPINGPTLFYMPHNEVDLYDSVVRTGMEPFKLKQIVILGNSFSTYSDRWTMYPLPDGDIPSYLLEVQEFVEEIPIADDFYPSAFNDTSWHFFSNVEARQLR